MEEKLCECGCGKPTKIAKSTKAKWGHIKGQPLRYIHGHSGNRVGSPKPVQYIVEDRGYTTPCWIWQLYIGRRGYGRVKRNGEKHTAHRYMYEKHKGKIPEGLQLDHLCRVRSCVNPDHLEPVTNAENTIRGYRSRKGSEKR